MVTDLSHLQHCWILEEGMAKREWERVKMKEESKNSWLVWMSLPLWRSGWGARVNVVFTPGGEVARGLTQVADIYSQISTKFTIIYKCLYQMFRNICNLHEVEKTCARWGKLFTNIFQIFSKYPTTALNTVPSIHISQSMSPSNTENFRLPQLKT